MIKQSNDKSFYNFLNVRFCENIEDAILFESNQSYETDYRLYSENPDLIDKYEMYVKEAEYNMIVHGHGKIPIYDDHILFLFDNRNLKLDNKENEKKN